MNWLLPASMASFLAIAVLATTNWYIYSRYRQRHMLYWSLAWTLSCLRHACMMVQQSTHPMLPLEVGYYAFAVLSAQCIVVGAAHFLARPVPRWLTPLAVSNLVWIAVAVPLGLPPFWQQAPVFWFLAGSLIMTGYSFLRVRRDAAYGSLLPVAVGGTLMVWGLHQADYPFLRQVVWFAPFGFLLSAIFALATAVGMLTLYFERAYDEAADRAAELASSEQRFRRLFDSAPDAVYLHDLQGKILDANQAACDALGYGKDQLLTMGVADVEAKLGQEDLDQLRPPTPAGHTATIEGLHRRADGSTFPVEVHIAVLGTDPPLCVASARDVTERQRAAIELAVSEERFRLLAENCSDTISRHALDGTYLYVSPACERLMGYRPEEMVGRPGADFIHPDDHPAVLASLATIMAGPGVALTQFRALRRDGTEVWVESNSHAIRDPATGQPTEVHVSTRDITERLEAEAERARLSEQLAHARQMESVGRLAGGVAHDFNNMLQAILGNADLLLLQLPAGSPLRGGIEEIVKSARRSADLTRQLLGYARRQTIVPRVLDLNNAVEGTLGMLRRLIGEGTVLDWRPGAALWPVHMDPSQVDQLLVNLSVNARDAIRGIGRVTLTTSNVTLGAGHPVAGASCPPGRYVRLTVSDTGAGMDEYTREHLFEPFFTTKGVGQGTGLGLATVHGIVTQNGGAIDVDSTLGAGSTFSLYLPAADAELAHPVPAAAAQPAGGTETLLLVEDEPQILCITQQTLEQQGYTVLAAVSPDAALTLADAHPGPIEMLVTDVIMPRMNGRQLADRLLVQRPQLRCLFVSGYDADIIAQQGLLPEQTELLAKPFSLDELALRVRHLLDQP
ncbi:MAG: PAS domain S-box protein [Armatimonadetes bacterium]|nr:PAS domain S-box protein [Armatimonadota bacterium]